MSCRDDEIKTCKNRYIKCEYCVRNMDLEDPADHYESKNEEEKE